MNITRVVIGLALSVAVAPAADERPRLHPLPAESRNAKTGLPAGSRIPNFDLIDVAGQHQTFDSLRGPKGLALVFARSAAWSSSCRAQIIDFDSRAPDFRRKGLGVAVITYDSTAALQTFAQERNITIPLLADPGSQTIKAFGILNPNPDAVALTFGVPFPGVFILDERGVVAAKYFIDDQNERFSAAAILTREFGFEGAMKTVIDTPQLTLTYSVSDSTVSPGTRLTLIIDIEPKPRMHVFAPGTLDYIPVEWHMGTSKAWIAFPITYPAGRTMHLPGVNERVPSYDRHVRLIRDIVIGQENALAPALTPNRSLSVEGAFRFEACDDKECFLPRTLLLRWVFSVRALMPLPNGF